MRVCFGVLDFGVHEQANEMMFLLIAGICRINAVFEKVGGDTSDNQSTPAKTADEAAKEKPA